MTAQQLLLFIPAAFLLAAAPGPDNFGVLALGLSAGRRASLGFALGCAVGCLNHTLLAVIGVSALIAASPLAFALLQWAGAAYLTWIGVQSLRQIGSAAKGLGASSDHDTAFFPHFRRGLIANAINPKVAIFFLAFLPQFVRPGPWGTAAQLAVFGCMFACASALAFSALALCAGSIGAWLTRRPRALAALQGATGLLFIGLAIRLVLADMGPHPQH